MAANWARSPRWSARSARTSLPPAPTWAASAAKYLSRSAGSAHSVTASSTWSTTRVWWARGPSRTKESVGCPPGVQKSTGVPLRTKAANTPARTSEDLPTPDEPTTTRTPVSRSRRRQTAMSCSRPK